VGLRTIFWLAAFEASKRECCRRLLRRASLAWFLAGPGRAAAAAGARPLGVGARPARGVDSCPPYR